eukprot:909736-Prorocentrum_minimum.AAC.1
MRVAVPIAVTVTVAVTVAVTNTDPLAAAPTRPVRRQALPGALLPVLRSHNLRHQVAGLLVHAPKGNSHEPLTSP